MLCIIWQFLCWDGNICTLWRPPLKTWIQPLPDPDIKQKIRGVTSTRLVKIQYTELKLSCGNDPVVKNYIYSNDDLDLWSNDPKINRVPPLPQGNHVAKFVKDSIYRTKVIVRKRPFCQKIYRVRKVPKIWIWKFSDPIVTWIILRPLSALSLDEGLNALSGKHPLGCWLVQPTNQMSDISAYAH